MCRYAGVRPDVVRLRQTYQTYIEEGRTDLLNLPYYMAQVAAMVDDAKAKRDLKKSDKEKSLDILRSEGLVK